MRNKFGNFCMVLGAALVIGALALFLLNQQEAEEAQQASDALLPQLVEEIQIANAAGAAETAAVYEGVPVEFLEPEAFEMTEVEIDGHMYIGYLSIPSLELELPVMSDWNYDKLQIAPCRYSGSVLGQDLVLMAHNYPKHFGKIKNLSEGDAVTFVDMDGVTTHYEVVAQEVLQPDAVEEMVAGDFDLTLFTCTYGGQSRVTVYCDIVE